MDEKLKEYLADAEESLRVAIEACERLADECKAQNAGEGGGAAGRMYAYIIPSLQIWLESDSQVASLRDLREELEQGWTWLQREKAGEREFNPDGTAKNSEMTSEEARNFVCQHPSDRVDDDGWCEDCGDLIHLIDEAEAHQEHLAGAECKHEMVRVDNEICETCNQKVEWKEDRWEVA